MVVYELGYAVLEMQDANAWGQFAVDVLGFSLAKHDEVALRMDDEVFRYLVLSGDEDKFLCAGYKIDDLEDAVETLKVAGVDVRQGSREDSKKRKVVDFYYFNDPSDNRVEIYETRNCNEGPFTPGHNIKEFKTGKMGLGHLVLPAPKNEDTIAFYTDLMGFSVSDDLTLPAFAEGLPEQRIYFMHADNPRHHTLGLYNFPNSTGVIHLMAEVGDIDEVGDCMERVKKAGLHIFASLGRHANDEMISFYFFAPGGIGFEIGYDGKQVKDWSKFKPTKSTIGDLWGHEYDFPVVG